MTGTNTKIMGTRAMLMVGLLILAIAMSWWLYTNTTRLGLTASIVTGSIFPLLLLYLTARKIRNWSGITALCMIPYAVIGTMEIIATLGTVNTGMAIAVLSIGNFFAALDAGRRNI